MAHGDTAKLAMMANQIALFFKAYPHDTAVAGVASHIEAFWTPRMRATLCAALDDGALKLEPLVVEALSRGQDRPSPVDRVQAGPEEVGQLGAVDAG